MAIRTLDDGLARFADSPAADRVRALLYRAELAVRLNDGVKATASLHEAQVVELTDADQAALDGDIAHVTELVAGIG